MRSNANTDMLQKGDTATVPAESDITRGESGAQTRSELCPRRLTAGCVHVPRQLTEKEFVVSGSVACNESIVQSAHDNELTTRIDIVAGEVTL